MIDHLQHEREMAVRLYEETLLEVRRAMREHYEAGRACYALGLEYRDGVHGPRWTGEARWRPVAGEPMTYGLL